MAVSQIQETWDNRGGDGGADGRAGASRSFRVIVDDPRTAYTDIALHEDIPKLGSLHPENFALYCARVSVVQRNKFLWEVSVGYSNESEKAEDPTDDAAEIDWDTEQFQKPAVKDRDGNAILNSAGDPFDPPAEMDDSRRVVTIKKNMEEVPSWILDFQDVVNSSSFSVDGITVAAGLAKVQRVSVGAVQRRNDISYRPVTIVLHLRRDGWALEILNRGFRWTNGAARIKVSYTDSGTLVSPGDPVENEPTEPVLLDADGLVLSDPTPETATYGLFNVYEERSFADLPLS